MKVKKTILQLRVFDIVSGGYLEKHKDKENKLCASIKQVSKQLVKVFEDYNEELEDIRLDNCSVDEKTKVILKDEKGGKMFTVEATKKANRLFKELLKKEVEIHARISADAEALIPSLTDEERESFSEIIIPKQTDLDESESDKTE